MRKFRKPRAGLKIRRARAGLGLYTEKPIVRQAFIAEYAGEIISGETADRKDSRYLFEISKNVVIDGSSRQNIARYINHGCKPNCYAEIDSRRVYIYAKRKIGAGEELTYNYGKEYFDDFIKPHGCRCASCSGSH